MIDLYRGITILTILFLIPFLIIPNANMTSTGSPLCILIYACSVFYPDRQQFSRDFPQLCFLSSFHLDFFCFGARVLEGSHFTAPQRAGLSQLQQCNCSLCTLFDYQILQGWLLANATNAVTWVLGIWAKELPNNISVILKFKIHRLPPPEVTSGTRTYNNQFNKHVQSTKQFNSLQHRVPFRCSPRANHFFFS